VFALTVVASDSAHITSGVPQGSVLIPLLWSFLNSYLVMFLFKWVILLVCANLRSLTIIVCGLCYTITSLNIAEIFWAVVFLNTMNSGLVACSLTIKTTYLTYLNKIFSSTLHGGDIVCSMQINAN
jgi:hypothetical protein